VNKFAEFVTRFVSLVKKLQNKNPGAWENRPFKNDFAYSTTDFWAGLILYCSIIRLCAMTDTSLGLRDIFTVLRHTAGWTNQFDVAGCERASFSSCQEDVSLTTSRCVSAVLQPLSDNWIIEETTGEEILGVPCCFSLYFVSNFNVNIPILDSSNAFRMDILSGNAAHPIRKLDLPCGCRVS
jgi:hypothetical protein